PDRRISLLCCAVLDEMLFCESTCPCPTSPVLISTLIASALRKCLTLDVSLPCVLCRIQIFDASLCGVSASAEALQRFFTHSLTQTLTYKPRLTVSDAITLQNEWTFAKASRLLTSLFRKLAVIFSVELLLRHLQQVLETHEVNWKHVLCFLSTLLVYNPCAQSSLRDLLSRLLTSAFEGYDLENMITAFLLARQAALEGTAIFSSYSDWFKMSFGGGSGYHATSKKSLVFLLKFLSDLVPFEPPQYLKVHILHPPYIPVKHRNLLMEYISLAKTRLADLKVRAWVKNKMIPWRNLSSPQCQAAQDVEKAVSLFESTGRISATVMEASIFRRPYFLTRFLPALLTPRVVSTFSLHSLTNQWGGCFSVFRADKIPAAQYSSYEESCQRQRHSTSKYALIKYIAFFVLMLYQFAVCISVCVCICSYSQVINMILRNFCQCMLDASRANPPNKQSPWASRFVTVLLGNIQLLSSLIHRLWDLFHNQGSSLSAAHVLGLAAFAVHLNASMCESPLIQLVPPILPKPVPVGEALSSALVCSTHTNMLFSVRLCVSAVCYGICRGDSLPQPEQQDYILSSLYKKVSLHLTLTPLTADVSAELIDLVDKNKSSTFVIFVQLSFSEWLATELRVQRGEDALSDPERQEYQQWACLELYWSRPEQQGGCGGDMKSLCSHLLSVIMDQQLRWTYMFMKTLSYSAFNGHIQTKTPNCNSLHQSLDKLHHRVSDTGTCLPDILSRLQVCVHCMRVFKFSRHKVLLALPAVLFVKVKTEGGRTTLDCNKLIEHVNQHQRKVCSPAGLMSCHVTAHFLRGVLYASVRCRCPREEVNKAWSQISLHCPLLLTSTVHWWECLFPVLVSLWSRLCGGEPLSEQMQLLSDFFHRKLCLIRGCFLCVFHCLYIYLLLSHLFLQVLVFLLFLSVNDCLSALLYPQVSDHVQPQTISTNTNRLCSGLCGAVRETGLGMNKHISLIHLFIHNPLYYTSAHNIYTHNISQGRTCSV
uniref:Uncharacterized protein n=1 Tax=Lates calcarifer TaxID=8187 RepID=A0A4W6EN85_LATCA